MKQVLVHRAGKITMNRNLWPRLNFAMLRNMTNFVEEVREFAREGSPHLTGNNKRSIKAKQIAGDPLAFTVFTSSNYGAYLELGTSKMGPLLPPKLGGGKKRGPRPYFAPALTLAANNLKKKTGADWE